MIQPVNCPNGKRPAASQGRHYAGIFKQLTLTCECHCFKVIRLISGRATDADFNAVATDWNNHFKG